VALFETKFSADKIVIVKACHADHSATLFIRAGGVYQQPHVFAIVVEEILSMQDTAICRVADHSQRSVRREVVSVRKVGCVSQDW
jgi:hypothetical protein